MKRIVLSLFLLAMVFAGCEKVEDHLESIELKSKKKSELPNGIEVTTKVDSVYETSQVVSEHSPEGYDFQLWRPEVDSGFTFPFFSPIADSIFSNYTPFIYWKNYPLLLQDSIGKND